MKHQVPIVLAALSLAACTLDPAYHAPFLPTASQYPSQDAAYQEDAAHQSGAPAAAPAALLGWRAVFTDPRLQALIALALQNNRDLRVAIFNVAASQSSFRAQRAELFPAINADTDATLEGLSTSAAEPELAQSSGSTIPTQAKHSTYREYSAGIGFASYELDMFGRVRSLTRSQYQQYLSEADTRRSVQISVVAEVANDYITLLADQDELKLAQATAQSQARLVGLTQAMFDQGVSSQLNLFEAQTGEDTATASVARYQRQVAQDENALTLVVGTPLPANLPPGADLAAEGIMADLPDGLPSDLLSRRPDVMAAEHTLLAANAQIGAARAAFFPSISLTGNGGLASASLNKLFDSAAQTWTFAPQVTIPIFTWGQNQANLDNATAEKNVDLARYENTIQTAFREVSDGLAARGTYLDQLAAQQADVDAFSGAYQLAELRYRTGADTYESALETQQSLFSAQQTLISLKAEQLQNLVTLYEALGGGWYATTPAPAAIAAAAPVAQPPARQLD